MWAIATNALTSRQRASGAASEAIARRAGLEIFRQPPSPDGKARYQPATTDFESFTHPNAIVLDPFAGSGSNLCGRPPVRTPVYRYRAA